MDRHAQNAATIAETLTRHARVSRVYYPGLAGHPGHAIAQRQMSGYGGMVSFELAGTPEEAAAFVSSLEFFALGESLGGVRSLICLPCRMTHASIPAATRAELGLSDTLIRLSPGCESSRDLVRDLVGSLDRLGAPVRAQEAAAAR
jgi:cystathionine gamma-synthase